MPINAVNLTGTIFPAGPKGETGPANNLEIGTVEKGIEASATITGESPNQVLNLVLPIGPKGETGPANNLEIGTVEKGIEASATITGESPNLVLNLVLPIGPKGEQGLQGEIGPANSLTIGTVEKGTEPSATITGDAPNQVLNLVLPTGETAEIEALKAKHAQEISALENLIPTGQASGESIDLNDSAEYKFKKFGISGNSKQETRSGKNKADINNYYYDTINYSDLNISLNNGEFTISTDGAKIVTEYIKIPIKINSNGTYMFGIDLKTNKAGDTAQALAYDYTNKKIIGTTFTNTDTNYITKTQQITIDDSIDKDNILIFLYCPNNGTVGQAYSFSYKNIFFNEGTNTEYEPYGAMPSPEFPSEIKNVTGNVNITVCNKNFFDGELEIAEYDNTGNKIKSSVWVVNKNIIKVRGNTTYTISQKETPSQYRIICFKDDTYLESISSSQNISTGYRTYTFITPNNCNKIYIQFRSTLEIITSGTYDMTINSITNAQLVLGTSIEYVEHQSQTITFPLAEGQKLMLGDYLADDGIHHNRKTITLNGTENISVYIPNVLSDMFGFYIINIEGAFAHCKILSSHFKFKSIFNSEESRVYSYTKNILYFIIPKTIASTVDEVKTYLAEQYANNTPVVVEYELSQEEIEPYTEEQQEVYDKIKELYSYKGTTHITCEDEVSCIFQAEYYKDLETILNNMQAQILAE